MEINNCYLTKSCELNQQKNEGENYYIKRVLNWFLANYVTDEERAHYNRISPIVIEEIDSREDSEKIYYQIYNDVVIICIKALERGDIDFAHTNFISSLKSLEENFAEPLLKEKTVKTLRLN